MLVVDIILIGILLAAAWRGWKNGLIESLGELVGAAVAFVAARYVSSWFGMGFWRVVVFILVAIIIAKLVGTLFHWAASLLKIVTSLPFINLAQKSVGAILGFCVGIVLVGSTTYIVLFYSLHPMLTSWLGGSYIARLCEMAFSTSLRFLL